MNSNNIEDKIMCTVRLITLKEFIHLAFKSLRLNWKDYLIYDKKYLSKNVEKTKYL